MKKCCVIGLGYIGLPTAGLLASKGFDVVGVDINEKIINTINKGNIHIIEKDLEKVISKAVRDEKLIAKPQPCKADIYLIAVPTPFRKTKDRIPQPDLSFVLQAVRSVAQHLNKNNLLIIESTCPIGSTEKILDLILQISNLDKSDINIAYCPERVLPGSILHELENNDRVIGGISQKSSNFAKSFYSKFCSGELIITDCKTAEMVKLSENSFRDVNIAFANELSMLCDEVDVDVHELVSIANRHPRVNILIPGCGVGGHCIAVDPWFLASQNENITKIIQTARIVNNAKKDWVVKKIKKTVLEIEKDLKRSVSIACLGLSYKPNIDDLRESPALDIVMDLINSNMKVLVCEPNLKSHPNIDLHSIHDITLKADLITILVPHKEFYNLKFSKKMTLDFCKALSS